MISGVSSDSEQCRSDRNDVDRNLSVVILRIEEIRDELGKDRGIGKRRSHELHWERPSGRMHAGVVECRKILRTEALVFLIKRVPVFEVVSMSRRVPNAQLSLTPPLMYQPAIPA